MSTDTPKVMCSLLKTRVNTHTQMHTSSQALRVCELTNDRLAEPTPKDLAWNYDVVRVMILKRRARMRCLCLLKSLH